MKTRRRQARVARRRTATVGVVATAAVAAAVVSGRLVEPDAGTGRMPITSAQGFLLTAAHQTGSMAAPSAPYLRVQYDTRTALGDLASGTFRGLGAPTHVVSWFGRDGTSYLSHDGAPAMSTWRGRGPARPFALGTDDPGLSWREVRALPSDPRALARRMDRAGQGGKADTAAVRFSFVGTLLATAPLSGAQREALLMIASRLPGARLVGRATDTRGRVGTAIEVSDERSRTRLILGKDGRPLEQTVVALAGWQRGAKVSTDTHRLPAVPAGETVERTVFLGASGVQRPPVGR